GRRRGKRLRAGGPGAGAPLLRGHSRRAARWVPGRPQNPRPGALLRAPRALAKKTPPAVGGPRPEQGDTLMEGLGRAPARTEADLRAALAELARRAPNADEVLSALREAGPRRQQRSPRPGRLRAVEPGRGLIPPPGWPPLAAGARPPPAPPAR